MINKSLLIVFCVFFLTNCAGKNNEYGFYFGVDNQKGINVSKYEFYRGSQGEVFLNIIKDVEKERVKTNKISYVELRTKDSIYKGKLIVAAFSREINLTPFICYTYDNGKVNFESFGNKDLIYIGQESDLEPLINSSIITDIKSLN